MTPMERLFESAKALPSIPKVLHEILATLNQPDVDVDDISKPLGQDPALSAKVLRMANAAHFGLQRKVASVDDAIVMVGLDAVRTLVIASGLVGSFTAIPGFDMQRFWRLSVLAGYIAKDMARKLKEPHESAYTAALMHGLGVISIHSVFPEAAQAIDKMCQGDSATERAQHERDKLGFNHAEVSSEIANRWKLPPEIGLAIHYYPEPNHANAPVLSAIVQCAIALAIDLQNEKPVEEWGNQVDPTVTAKLGLDWDAIRYKAENLQQQKEMADQIVS